MKIGALAAVAALLGIVVNFGSEWVVDGHIPVMIRFPPSLANRVKEVRFDRFGVAPVDSDPDPNLTGPAKPMVANPGSYECDLPISWVERGFVWKSKVQTTPTRESLRIWYRLEDGTMKSEVLAVPPKDSDGNRVAEIVEE